MTMGTGPSAPMERHGSEPEQDFDQLAAAVLSIEHLTVPGFLRRIPHRWSFEDITRYGDKVGRAAESMQLAYVTTMDRSLGVIRTFPVPLLQRVYEILATQYGWPRIIEAPTPALDDSRRVNREALKAHERMEKHLRAMLESVASDDVQGSIATLLGWMGQEIERLRAELGEEVEA